MHFTTSSHAAGSLTRKREEMATLMGLEPTTSAVTVAKRTCLMPALRVGNGVEPDPSPSSAWKKRGKETARFDPGHSFSLCGFVVRIGCGDGIADTLQRRL
jgi:hypothetical protein